MKTRAFILIWYMILCVAFRSCKLQLDSQAVCFLLAKYLASLQPNSSNPLSTGMLISVCGRSCLACERKAYVAVTTRSNGLACCSKGSISPWSRSLLWEAESHREILKLQSILTLVTMRCKGRILGVGKGEHTPWLSNHQDLRTDHLKWWGERGSFWLLCPP